MSTTFTIEQVAIVLGIEDDGEAWRTRPLGEPQAIILELAGLLRSERVILDPFMVGGDDFHSSPAACADQWRPPV